MILVVSSRCRVFAFEFLRAFVVLVCREEVLCRIGIPEIVVVTYILAMALLVIWPAVTICRRLGFPPWLGILAAIPLANVVLLWYVALAQWPKADPGPQSI